MRHWRGRVAGFVAGLLLGGWLIATPAAQSYVWGAINGIPFGPGLVLSGPLLLPDGTAAAPALAFANYQTSGMSTSSGGLVWSVVGTQRMALSAFTASFNPSTLSGSTTASAQALTQTWNTTGAPVLVDWTITDTASDAASLAFRIRGGAAGTTELIKVGKTGRLTVGENIVVPNNAYYTMTSRFAIGSASEGVVTATNSTVTGLTTLNLGPTTGNSASGSTSITHVNSTIDAATATGTGTGTLTVANFFPAGCTLDGFSGRVTTILAGAGLTTFSIGPTADTDAYGTGLAIAANTLISPATYTITSTGQVFSAASNLVITAAAGVFSTGVLKVTATCKTFTPIGS